MQFTNKTGESKKVKVVDTQEDLGFKWITVLKDESVDLPRSQGLALGFKPEKKKVEESDEEQQSNEDYRKKLMSVDGIGKKTAEDIMKAYPTADELRDAISEDKELPIREDLVEMLEEEFLE